MREVIEVHAVEKIDRDIYKCVTEDIVADEVILTDERIQHIKDRHPDKTMLRLKTCRIALFVRLDLSERFLLPIPAFSVILL